jgi:diguanylate cyclase (GGDEF)-like protein
VTPLPTKEHEIGRIRTVRRDSTKAAALGMIVVLLALSGFATWSSLTASAAGANVAGANARLVLYQRARFDVAAEESLERKYRLEPGPVVSQAHTQAGTDLVGALKQLASGSTGAEHSRLEYFLRLHATYVTAAHRLFAATDAGNPALALSIDHTVVDPVFGVLQSKIDADATRQTVNAHDAVTGLRRTELTVRVATPIIFTFGLALLLVFLRISRTYQRTIRGRALRDELTGLPNRECFYDRAAHALLAEQRRQGVLSVLVIDLDRFKELNDTLGHRYGDKLLCLIGPRISPLLRQSDTVARLGGDEFAVLLPDSGGPAAAQDVADRIVAALHEPFALDSLTFTIAASCGVASSPDDGVDVDELLQHADVAMYIAKDAHSGAVSYNPTLDINTPKRLAILNELPRAIKEGHLRLHYQPKSDVATGRVTGMEALVRWEHPVRGLIPPDDFIPLAEHTGLITPLTTWVLNEALTQCRHWLDTTTANLSISINLAARTLLDEKFPAEVSDALRRHGVPARLLNFEVTETSIMVDPLKAQSLLQKIHDLGVELSIDDFGTGYSSLSYLKFLPVSELKIDQSFVKHMHDDANDAVIVRSVIDLAHNLGLKTVAEGIEDEATLQQLDILGCDLGQGYHLARPMPAAAVDEWLRAQLDHPVAAGSHSLE